ncbi:putative duf1772 domain containing protein [Phaeoacremonium minimum UCRPA7]|uniref:Putative duf1772 domain containing protein n=1 Tax=Phaeoacremonium minimum (strain UCR-PA7) TaxID=1286976 RepID=R8BHR0_PHAM7|nr:putative duf1772 domain containing protein [Phaeoacremonium minimum UCRPA7]EON98797.1 putative duf1772 domain containing protein [Phaeoacremonium minimum UCRPA7]
MVSIGTEVSHQMMMDTMVDDTINRSHELTAEAGASSTPEFSAVMPAAMSNSQHGAGSDDQAHLNPENASIFNQDMGDAVEVRRLLVTQEGSEAAESSSKSNDELVASDFKVVESDDENKETCLTTSPEREPGSIRTWTYDGYKYIALAPISLSTASPSSAMSRDSSQEPSPVSEPASPSEDAMSPIPDQVTNGDDSGPESYPKSVPSSSPALDVRTFANDLIYVGKSNIKGAGFGMFAARDISDGQPILLEKPLLRTTWMNLFKSFDKLKEDQQAILLSLARFHPREDADPVEQMFNANSYVWDDRRKMVVFTAAKDISAHEELLISYNSDIAVIKNRFGFTCTCAKCSSRTGNGGGNTLRPGEFY